MNQDFKVITQNAADTVAYVKASSDLIQKQASLIDRQRGAIDTLNQQLAAAKKDAEALSKQASASGAPVLDEKLLKQASEKICQMYGNTKYTPDDLVSAFQQNPNKLLSVMSKMASDYIDNVVSGAQVGQVVTKTASNESAAAAQGPADTAPSYRRSFVQVWRGASNN